MRYCYASRLPKVKENDRIPEHLNTEINATTEDIKDVAEEIIFSLHLIQQSGPSRNQTALREWLWTA